MFTFIYYQKYEFMIKYSGRKLFYQRENFVRSNNRNY